MTASHRPSSRSSSARRGFTLLEVVLAALLIGVLMAAVYQSLFIYQKLFSRGETRTEEIQLARTLTQQLSDDLVGAIQDPVFVDPRSKGPTGARRFGLYGTGTELRIDVLQIPAFQPAPTPTAEEMEDTTKPRKLQAPELRTIYYSFYESIDPADEALPDARVGLTRRELDFETPEKMEDTELPDFADVSFDVPLDEELLVEDPQAPSPLPTFEEMLEVGMESSVMWAPEVVSLQFRYFDGSRWRDSWDSLARKGIPVAVEMTIAVAPLEEANEIRLAATGDVSDTEGGMLVEEQELVAVGGETEDDVVALGEDENTDAVSVADVGLAGQSSHPQSHIHRVVIYLPNSPLQKARKGVKRRAAPTLAAPTALPKLILQPARPKTSTQRVSPDQWIRNE